MTRMYHMINIQPLKMKSKKQIFMTGQEHNK